MHGLQIGRPADQLSANPAGLFEQDFKRSPDATAIECALMMVDPVLQARYSTLTHELRCVQCQAESIADSPVPIAADMRRVVAEMVKAGKSDQDVRNFMTERYGDYILFKPRSLLLWIMPGLLLAIGAAVAWRIVSQRRTLLATDSEPVEDDA